MNDYFQEFNSPNYNIKEEKSTHGHSNEAGLGEVIKGRAISTGMMDFMKVTKINANKIDFSYKHIGSSDSYNSLSNLTIDFAKIIAKAASSKFITIAFFDPEVIEYFCYVYPK